MWSPLLLSAFQSFPAVPASAYICSSQRYQKLKKDHAKDATSTTPKVTPTKASAVPKTPKTPKTPKATGKSSKLTKVAAKKRKRAESSELSTHDSDSDDATAAVNDDSDVSPKKKVKAEPGNSKTEIIKSEEETADGSVDVAQDS